MSKDEGSHELDRYLRDREDAYSDLDFGGHPTFELPADLSAIARGLSEIDVNSNPLQRVAGLELIQTAKIGGPSEGRDVRMTLDAGFIEQLLEQAKRSRTGRAVIHKAGIIVNTWRDMRTGHVFQTLQISGVEPKPEDPLIIRTLTGAAPGRSL